MYLTVKQQVKHLTKTEYNTLRDLCHAAKDLANEAIYNSRQYFFSEGKFLCYEQNYALLKNNANYKKLNSNMAQQILREVHGSFKSFFALREKAKHGNYSLRDVRLPRYYEKEGFCTLVISMVRITKNNTLILPYSREYAKDHDPVVFKVPPVLHGKHIREVRIIPGYHARFFEIQYTYDFAIEKEVLNQDNVLALDPGVDNLVTAVSSSGGSFIIDGRVLKSWNQWYNKERARLSSINDKQPGNPKVTKRMADLAAKRNRRVNDYMSKAARYIIRYCVEHDIGTIVMGYNVTFQRNANLGRRNNQNFTQIPFGKLRKKLEYLCELYGIRYIEQEESYTSKASFWDRDPLPAYNADNPADYTFSGVRVRRGLYRTSAGRFLNADVNGALNIMRKSNVADLTVLYARGGVDTPVRIRVA